MVCEIDVGAITGKRRFTVVTCFDNDQFDVYIDLMKQI
jgi:hypothetical protein